jgi:signal transduction histidine kinase
VGAVLVTTVATLAVAAAALLGPLEKELRKSAQKTLVADVTRSGAVRNFNLLDLTYALDTVGDPGYREGRVERAQLRTALRLASERLGATVTLYGYPSANGNAIVVPTQPPTGDESQAEVNPRDVARAFRSDGLVGGLGTLDGNEVARVAAPLMIGAHRYVLAVRRPITEVANAVSVVRKAFITAALAGLALTLVLAIPLAARIVRRLRRLREAALELARDGTTVDVPVDRRRDEVGDLTRSFAIMQRRIQHQEEARRAFVATASHELRTPLTSLDGLLELLADDLRGGTPDLDDARALLDRARAQSRRLARLAADLLDLSRMDAEVALRSEPVELGELSRAVLAEFELGTHERGIVSALSDPGHPVWATGDPGSVARILRILLDNAVRVTPSGHRITIELRDVPTTTLRVADEGPGVADSERELIFERFHRGRDTGGQAGFGLGLAIGRELAERMGGTLVLERSDGPGATFALTLPAARAPQEDPLAVG